MTTQNTNPVKVSHTTGPPPIRRSSNMMKKADEYKLMQWLDANRDYIRNNKLTAQKVAEEFQSKTSIITTGNNIKSCCKALGFLLPISQKRVGNRAIIRQLEERITQLEEKYKYLCTKLGVADAK